jgi:hypothetical protein
MGINNPRLEINTRMRAKYEDESEYPDDECLTAHIRKGKYPERYSLVNFYPDTEK